MAQTVGEAMIIEVIKYAYVIKAYSQRDNGKLPL